MFFRLPVIISCLALLFQGAESTLFTVRNNGKTFNDVSFSVDFERKVLRTKIPEKPEALIPIKDVEATIQSINNDATEDDDKEDAVLSKDDCI